MPRVLRPVAPAMARRRTRRGHMALWHILGLGAGAKRGVGPPHGLRNLVLTCYVPALYPPSTPQELPMSSTTEHHPPLLR